MGGTMPSLKRIFLVLFLFSLPLFFYPCQAPALEVNADGRQLISEATQAYGADLRGRPVILDPAVVTYAESIIRRLRPDGKNPPEGVTLTLTVIESPRPELYSYVDGHIVTTTGLLYAMDNEAQLAGVLSHEVAHVVEGYYINMYQEIKAAERNQHRRAAAGALLGAMLDIAVDYTVEMEHVRETERVMAGEATYRETMERMAAVGAAQTAYYSIKDVISNIPKEDAGGKTIDPRLRFEPVADAHGMEYLALAGYDAEEVSSGWNHVLRINNDLARQQDQALGGMASQIRAMQGLMEIQMQRMRQTLGSSGLVQTPMDVPESRARFSGKLIKLEEVRKAQQLFGKSKGVDAYRKFIQSALLERAGTALEEENYETARTCFQTLYDKGLDSAQVNYGLAKSMLGDFAFGASTAEKKASEKYYRQALKKNKKFAPAYRGLGELYEDWERYADAVEAYRAYLKIAPDAPDSRKIKRKIKTLKRKAER